MFIYGIGICFMSSVILGIFVIDESPRYLLSRNKIEDTKLLLQKMTYINSRPPFLFNFVDELEDINMKYIFVDD